MKKILLFILLALVVLVGVVLVKTFTFKSKQPGQVEPKPVTVSDEALQHFSKAIQLPTISYQDSAQFNPEPFVQLHALIDSSFPLIDSIFTKEEVNKYSLIYHWQGSDPGLEPLVLLAHQDVVPVEDPSVWTEPPFSGKIDGEYIWGRGTLDDKLSVFGLLEAAEMLLGKGYTPKRSIYFCFGHDEEISGHAGAGTMSKLLAKRGIKAYFVLDEGMMVTDGMVPGISKPVALIGVSEKGYCTLKLTAKMPGGHSSMPDKESSLATIAEAVTILQHSPFPASLSGATEYFINYAGPEMSFLEKMAFANTWLLGGAIINTMEASPSGNALVRTTTATTIFNAGVKENLIPSEASAIVNFRILPGQTTQDVIDFVTQTIGNPKITVELIGDGIDPSPVSPVDGEAFKTLSTSIKQVLPDAVIAPSLVLGATDARYYTGISPNVYRFIPAQFKPEDVERVHGINERISIKDYKTVIGFYYNLMQNATN